MFYPLVFIEKRYTYPIYSIRMNASPRKDVITLSIKNIVIYIILFTIGVIFF